MQQLGYRAVAYGFFEEDVQVAHTDECGCCAAPGVVQYNIIHAVTVAGKVIMSIGYDARHLVWC